MQPKESTKRARRSIAGTFTLTAVVLATMLVSSPAALAGGNSLNAKTCQKNGWTTLVTSGGAPFASGEACVSYGAKGGILKRAQTISFTSANPSPVVAGATYTPAAMATSGLPVTFTLDLASTGCSLSFGVVTFTGAGTCVIDADQAGDATYGATPQVQQSITVVPGADVELLLGRVVPPRFLGPPLDLFVVNGGPSAVTVTVVVRGESVPSEGGSSEFASDCSQTGTLPELVLTCTMTLAPESNGGLVSFSDSSQWRVVAEVTAADQPDPDSTPNNHVTSEDDYFPRSSP